MIVPDVNVLIYAYNSAFPKHAVARKWWEDTLTQTRPIGLSWVSILGFIRIMTDRRGS